MHVHEEENRWAGRDWLVVVVFLTLAHAVFFPVLKPGVFLYGTDTVSHDYPLLLLSWSHVLDHGEIMLWNPYLFCGLPALGTFAFCPFYPTMWLFAVLPFALAFSYQYILNNFLAGVWTYWAARWMGLRRTGAFFAGLVFMVSGHFVTLAHAGHLQKFAAIAWAPFVIGCATAAMRRRRWGYWVACGAGLAMQLLASHPQIAYYTVLCLALWTLWLAFFGKWEVGDERREAGDGKSNPKPNALGFAIAGIVLALFFGFLVSASQILPAIETAPISNRGGGISFETAAETSYPPLEFAEYLLPSFMGDNTLGSEHPYWGRWGTERIVTDYMGLVPIILFVYALAAGRDRNRWFWLAVLVGTGILAAGRFTPVYQIAFDWLPGLNRFRSPATAMVFIAWPVAIVAGVGLDVFVRRAGDDDARRRYVLISLVAAAAFLAVALILAAPKLDWPIFRSIELPLLREPGANTASIYTSMQRSATVAAAACCILAALAFSFSPLLKGSAVFRVIPFSALVVLAFLDPRLHETRYIRAFSARQFQDYQIYLVDHWSDSVTKKLPSPVRGIEMGNERSNRMATRAIATLHGYHPVHLQSYLDLLDLYAQNHAQLGRLVFEQFILTPEKRSPGADYRRSVSRDGRILWLRQPPLLYAYFPDAVEPVAGREAILSRMAADDFAPYRRSFTRDPALAYSDDDAATATATVVAHTPNRIDLAVSSDRERPLVVAELATAGWECITDSGARLPISTANYAFRAVRVPEGDHRLSLVYRPFSFRLGLYLTLAATLMLAAVAFAGIPSRLRRRKNGN